MKTGATLFSGFEGVGCGMKAAGIQHAWGIEYDPDIAVVAQGNGFAVTVADILECDPFDFEPVDVLHASPPCPNFSVAKAGGEETEHDIAMGRKVAEFVDVLRPSLFTLENVYGYRKAESFRHIVKALRDFGYHVRWWHLNSADYGVPQTRRRLILAAALDFTPQRPPATHQEPGKNAGQMSLFDDKLPPWVGWYEAIEDLIPELPDSAFAPWQLERLPAHLATVVVGSTVSAPKSFGAEPITTLTVDNGSRFRAFVADPNNPSREYTTRDEAAPMVTVAASHFRRPINVPKAFVMSGQLSETSTGMAPVIRRSSQPIVTLRATSNGGMASSYVAGRVVQMTPRALARFQSFPDDYDLPDSKTLACRGIGNAVPPLLMQRVLEAQR